MAITTNASYIPTITEFVDHWTEVNAARSTPFLLSDGEAVADLSTLKTDLQTIEGTLQQRLNDQQIARGNITATKQLALYWFGRFMDVFDGYFGAGPWAGARPLAPSPGSGVEEFTKPLIDMGDLWDRINQLGSATPPGLVNPLVLTGATSADTLALNGWTALITTLRGYGDDSTVAAGRVRRSRSRRNFTQTAAYEMMKVYRKAMPSALPSGDPLQADLPKLTVESTGATPDPVAASAIYLSGSTSKTVYEASTATDLKEYQLRGVIGDDWDEEDAVTLATHAKDAPREFEANFGLTQPGTRIVLKIYVITETGHERGSAAMVVDRV